MTEAEQRAIDHARQQGLGEDLERAALLIARITHRDALQVMDEAIRVQRETTVAMPQGDGHVG